MTDPIKLRRALADHLPRLAARADEIENALDKALIQPPPTPRRIGLSLAARYPELESVAAMLGAPPDALGAAQADAAVSATAVARASTLTRLVGRSPVLSEALSATFPQHGPAPPARVSVLIGDPWVDDNGGPIRPGGRPRWTIPWEDLERNLTDVVRSGKQAVRLTFERATYRRALAVLPDSQVAIILCHGSPEALAFESEPTSRWDLIDVDKRLPALFSGRGPQLVLVLACHGAPAARAIQRAGVPLAIGVAEDQPLPWEEAIQFAAAFLTSLLAGQEPMVAVDQARSNTPFARRFGHFGEEGLGLAWPPGELDTDDRSMWAMYRPRPAFVGREKELAALWGAVQEPGLTVVTGAPGQGKTELTYALLSRCRLGRHPPDGTLFVSLEGATTADDLTRAVVAALPGGTAVEEPGPAEAGALLGGAERLVVLDNAEDVLSTAEGRHAVRGLLDGALALRRVRVVVTSRDTLAHPGPMREVHVEPLEEDVDEARTLLLKVVAESHGSARAKHVAGKPALDDLLERLGRHPLSLRIAAALLALGDEPVGLLDDLDRLGGLSLRGGDDDRTTSLPASLRLSLDRLPEGDPGARAVWRALAELPVGVPDLAGLADQLHSAVTDLRSRSLLEARPAPLPRWPDQVYCLPPVRDFLAQLEDADAELVATLRAVVGESLAGQVDDVLPLTGTDVSVVATAWLGRWLLAIDDLLRRPPPASPWSYKLLRAARLALYDGLPQLAQEWCEGVTWSGRPDAGEGEARLIAGDVAAHTQRLIDARAHYDTALGAFRAVGDRLGEANTLMSMGDLAVREDRLIDARAHYDTALGAFRAVGDRLGEANTLMSMGELAVREDRLIDARAHYDTALGAFRAVGARLGEANTLRSMGDLAVREARLTDARAHYDTALGAFRAVGARLGEANTLKSMGDLAVREDRLTDARAHYDTALGAYRAVGERLGEANTLRSMGDLALAESDPAAAVDHAMEAAGLSLAIGDRLGASGALGTAGRAHLASGDPASALSVLLAARTHARAAHDIRNQSLVLADVAATLDALKSDAAGYVQAAAAVLASRAGVRLTEELGSLVARLEDAGQADELLATVDRYLDQAGEGHENPDGADPSAPGVDQELGSASPAADG